MLESKYSKILTIVLIIVILAIIVLLGFLAADYIKTTNNTRNGAEFTETYTGDVVVENTISNNSTVVENIVEPENLVIEPIDIDTNTNTNTSSGSSSTTTTRRKYEGLTVAGTMKIPTINLAYPIVEEPTTTALEKALVLLYPSSENLNQVGNTVIIGHNYRNGTFFSNISKLKNGDKIYITDFRNQTLTYEVYNVFKAGQTDTSFYNRDTNGLAEITLSTCTDASDDQRTIVFAKQVQ